MPSSERTRRPAATLTRVAVASALVWLLAFGLPASVLAADPTATPGGAAGDPRSSGQGPGLVGNPGWAVAIVAVIGITALVLTLAYVRVTREPPPPEG